MCNYLLTSLNYVNIRLLLDSGASRSCISERTFQRISARKGNTWLRLQKAPASTRLLSATGSPLQVIGEVMLDIRLCDYVIPQQFLVIRNLHHNGVLGMDMLQACNANINLQDKTPCIFLTTLS
jgi:hypothetical protein